MCSLILGLLSEWTAGAAHDKIWSLQGIEPTTSILPEGTRCARVLELNKIAPLNLAKLDDGLDESLTVMVVETKSKKLGNNRGILKPSWAFVETNIFL